MRLDKPKTSPWGSVVAAPVFQEVVERLVVLLELPPTGRPTMAAGRLRLRPMRRLTFELVIEALTGEVPAGAGRVLTGAVLDSREVIPGSLFVALQGEQVDGHDHLWPRPSSAGPGRPWSSATGSGPGR